MIPTSDLLTYEYLDNLQKNQQYITLIYVIKNNPKFPKIIYFVCKHNKQGLLQYIINHGANDFVSVLWGVCEGGYLQLAELTIKHGANRFNVCLSIACENGHFQLAELMIKHGAKHCSNCDNINHQFNNK